MLVINGMHILVQNLLSTNGPVGEFIFGFFWGFLFIFYTSLSLNGMLKLFPFEAERKIYKLCLHVDNTPSDDGIGPVVLG